MATSLKETRFDVGTESAELRRVWITRGITNETLTLIFQTYNEDHQVPDSAGTATAYFCGVKTNMGLIGIDARSRRGECSSQNDTELTSILDWSKAAGTCLNLLLFFLLLRAPGSFPEMMSTFGPQSHHFASTD